jgi:hypothetical protein
VYTRSEVAGEDPRPLDGVDDALRLFAVPRQRLRAEDGFAVPRAQLHDLLVQVVREADHDDACVRIRDRLFQVGRPARHAELPGELLRPFARARVHEVDAVAISLPVERLRVEEADQAGSEHRHLVAAHALPPAA